MQQLQLKDVQDNFELIFDDVLVSDGPVQILRDTGNAILVSDEFWRDVNETVNLVSIPDVRGSGNFRKGHGRKPLAPANEQMNFDRRNVVQQK